MMLLHKPDVWRAVLALMMAFLAIVGFWPSPVDKPVQGQLAATLFFLHWRGLPPWVNYSFVEASANVAMFVPLGIVAFLAFPRKQWWQVSAFGLLVSSCMELGQALFLHDRFASPLDLVTNTAGAVIGCLLAGKFLRFLKKRRAQRFSASSPSAEGL
ncbi:VanZ family protein [Arthrobacter sp. ISL-72]|nr:VanZ family protein [Arthrobacter sp. ISL-72]